MADIITTNPQTAATGTIQNTMTSPQAVVTQALQGTPPPQSATAPAQPQPTGKSNPFALSQVLQAIQTKVNSNNALMSQRNLLLKHLYNEPLTDQEKGQLDPTFKAAVDSNNRNQIDLSLRLIGDEVAGRKNTLDQSIQFLTNAYQQEQDRLDQERQNAINNVLNFAQTYGSNAKSALASLYGQEYVDQLKNLGVDIDAFQAISTEAERARVSKGGSGVTTIDLPEVTITDKATDDAVKKIIAQNPGEWGKAADAIDKKFGKGTATKYDLWLTEVYQNGKKVTDLNTQFNFDDPAAVNKLNIDPLTKAIINGTGSVKDLTPTMKGTVLSEMNAIGYNPNQSIIRKIEALGEMYKNLPSGAVGIIQGRIPSNYLTKGADPAKAAAFDSARTLLTRQVARLYDVGVLSDQDVASYNNAMPSRSDRNYDIVKGKIDGITGASVGKTQGDGSILGNYAAQRNAGTTSSGINYTIER